MRILTAKTDENHNVLEANALYIRVFGDLIGKSYLDVIPSYDHDYIKRRIQGVVASRTAIMVMHDVYYHGALYPSRWTDTPIYKKSGKLHYIKSIGVIPPP